MTASAPARRTPRRVVVVAVLVVLLASLVDVVVGAVPASAHAVVVSSTPVDGSEVQRAPRTVDIEFDEAVQLVPGTARVLSTAGDRADSGHARLSASGHGLVIPLRPGTPKGSYFATWRVVSADTHIVSGSIAFGVRQPARSAETGAAVGSGATTTPLDVVAQAAQGFGYLGVVLAFGVGAVGVLIWPSSLRARRSRALRWTGVGLLAAGALVEFLLEGPRAAEAGWSGVVRLADVGQTLSSAYGIALLVRVGVVLAAAPLLVGRLGARPPRPSSPSPGRPGAALGRSGPNSGRGGVRVLALLAAVVVLVTIALSGHAGVGSDAWLAIPAAVLHLSGMAVWLGGLATLALVVLPRLRRAPRLPLRALRAWSTTAFAAVVVLIVSGEYQAWREIRPLPALWGTEYGVTLLVKLGLVVVALLTALVPQRMLLRSGARRTDPARAGRTLRRAVAVESVVTIGVVAATTVLVALPPATTTYGPAATLAAPLGSDRLVVRVDTTRHGPEQLTVRAETPSGRAIRLQSLDATLSSSENDVSAIDVTLSRGADGAWRSSGMVVPLSGTWTVTFDASVDQATGYATKTEYTAW